MRRPFAIGWYLALGLTMALVPCCGDAEVVVSPEPPPIVSRCEDAEIAFPGECDETDGEAAPPPWPGPAKP